MATKSTKSKLQLPRHNAKGVTTDGTNGKEQNMLAELILESLERLIL